MDSLKMIIIEYIIQLQNTYLAGETFLRNIGQLCI